MSISRLPTNPLFPRKRASPAPRGGDRRRLPDFLPTHPFDHGNFDGRDERSCRNRATEESLRELRRDYFAVIEDLDRAVGKLLGRLEGHRRPKNVIVFTSDHGLPRDRTVSRQTEPIRPHLRVPIFLAGPGIRGPDRGDGLSARTSSRRPAISPASIAVPGSVTGRSFAEVLKGEERGHHDAVFGTFTARSDPCRPMMAGKWSFTQTGPLAAL